MRKPNCMSPPVRKVLLAAEPDTLYPRLLAYTGNLCQRIGAGVDVLWLAADPALPPILEAFAERMRQQRTACQILPRAGDLCAAVKQQVTHDHHIIVAVISANSEYTRKLGVRLPCPLIAVEQESGA